MWRLLALSDSETGLAGIAVALIAGIPGWLAYRATRNKDTLDAARLTDDDAWKRAREALQQAVAENVDLRRRLEVVEKHAQDCDKELARLRNIVEGNSP